MTAVDIEHDSNAFLIVDQLRGQLPGFNTSGGDAPLIELIESLQSLAGFHDCAVLAAPDAPGLAIVAGVLRADNSNRAISFTGIGESFVDALGSAYGEAAEIAALAHAERLTPACTTPTLLNIGWISRYRRLANREQSEIECERVDKPGVDSVPASLYLPNQRHAQDRSLLPPVSSGLGAGATGAAAASHATLELIEHDALANWWFGRRPAVALSIDSLPDAATFLHSVRDGAAHRRETVLFQLRSKFSIPVAGAASFDRRGQCFACGTAARSDLEAAAVAALREMCQIEFGHHCVRAKLAQLNQASLSVEDGNYIKRAKLITRQRFLPLLDHVAHSQHSDDSSWIDSIGKEGSRLPTPLWRRELSLGVRGIHIYKMFSPLLAPLSAQLWRDSPHSATLRASPYNKFGQLMP